MSEVKLRLCLVFLILITTASSLKSCDSQVAGDHLAGYTTDPNDPNYLCQCDDNDNYIFKATIWKCVKNC